MKDSDSYMGLFQGCLQILYYKKRKFEISIHVHIRKSVLLKFVFLIKLRSSICCIYFVLFFNSLTWHYLIVCTLNRKLYIFFSGGLATVWNKVFVIFSENLLLFDSSKIFVIYTIKCLRQFFLLYNNIRDLETTSIEKNVF